MKRFLSGIILYYLVSGFARAETATIKNKESSHIVTLELSTKGNDISFDQNAIEIPMAPVIKLRFVNKAAKDSQIQHNVAILKSGSLDTVIKDLQTKSYDVEKMRNNPNILAMTKVLEPGGDETVEFKPKEPGFYPYLCLMAGHGDMLNMRGILHVK